MKSHACKRSASGDEAKRVASSELRVACREASESKESKVKQ